MGRLGSVTEGPCGAIKGVVTAAVLLTALHGTCIGLQPRLAGQVRLLLDSGSCQHMVAFGLPPCIPAFVEDP